MYESENIDYDTTTEVVNTVQVSQGISTQAKLIKDGSKSPAVMSGILYVLSEPKDLGT